MPNQLNLNYVIFFSGAERNAWNKRGTRGRTSGTPQETSKGTHKTVSVFNVKNLNNLSSLLVSITLNYSRWNFILTSANNSTKSIQSLVFYKSLSPCKKSGNRSQSLRSRPAHARARYRMIWSNQTIFLIHVYCAHDSCPIVKWTADSSLV